MASGIARGRVCTAAMTTELHNMGAILQIMIETCSLGLSLLCSIDTCQNKLSSDQYQVTISRAQVYNSLRSHVFLKLTADQVLVYDWIVGSCQVNLLKTGQDCSETS